MEQIAALKTLREELQDWMEWDGAAYSLALCLGLMPEGIFSTRAKHVFWSNNPMGNHLYAMLDGLVAIGVLEKRDEPDFQYRWTPSFQSTWETAPAEEQKALP